MYWDRERGNLVYTAKADDGRVVYIPAELGWVVKKRGRLDALVNAFKIPRERLADLARYLPMTVDG